MVLPDFLHNDADGEVRLTGHRIRLIDVAARYDEGHSPETILLDHYPTLNLALIHKTVAFYLETEAEVRRMIEANAAAVQQLAGAPRRPTPTLDELRRRMQSRRGAAEAS